MADKNLMVLNNTSRDLVAILVCNILPFGGKLEGFAEEEAITIDEADNVETTVGVDGFMSAAVTNKLSTGTMTFAATSPALELVIDPILAAQDAGSTPIMCTLTITQPSRKIAYVLSPLVLKRKISLASMGKTLKDRTVTFDFLRVQPIPLGSIV